MSRERALRQLAAARTRLVMERPFLGALVIHLPMTATDRCRTTATDALFPSPWRARTSIVAMRRRVVPAVPGIARFRMTAAAPIMSSSTTPSETTSRTTSATADTFISGDRADRRRGR